MLLGCMMEIKWKSWLGVGSQEMEWRWVRLRGWVVDSASAFGFALAFAVGHGFQEYSMIWRSDELFWVGCGCGTDVSVVCWMRCGGV